jgi:zinc transporter ZupT
VESTTVLGGVAGIWWLPGASPWWINAVLAHAGGGFVFLALHAVFGELVKHGKGAVLANFGIGFMLLAVLRWMTHAH